MDVLDLVRLMVLCARFERPSLNKKSGVLNTIEKGSGSLLVVDNMDLHSAVLSGHFFLTSQHEVYVVKSNGIICRLRFRHFLAVT